jgi:hypothetical protein
LVDGHVAVVAVGGVVLDDLSEGEGGTSDPVVPFNLIAVRCVVLKDFLEVSHAEIIHESPGRFLLGAFGSDRLRSSDNADQEGEPSGMAARLRRGLSGIVDRPR